jgi:hypothetical protein
MLNYCSFCKGNAKPNVEPTPTLLLIRNLSDSPVVFPYHYLYIEFKPVHYQKFLETESDLIVNYFGIIISIIY